jgi:hypothetical protein
MTENDTPKAMSEEELFLERKELFRYTDLSHPLIKLLFGLKPIPPSEAE